MNEDDVAESIQVACRLVKNLFELGVPMETASDITTEWLESELRARREEGTNLLTEKLRQLYLTVNRGSAKRKKE